MTRTPVMRHIFVMTFSVCIVVFMLTMMRAVNASTRLDYVVMTKWSDADMNYVDSIISRLSQREKIGQLIMANFYGEDWGDLQAFLKHYPISGFMLNASNVQKKSFRELQSYIQHIQNIPTPLPMLLSVDQEGGRVQRLRYVLPEYPALSDLYRSKGIAGVRSEAYDFAQGMRKLGISMNFAPVVDVLTSEDSFIASRTASDDPVVNAEIAETVLPIYQMHGIIATLKHYPGYGALTGDPHDVEVVDPTTNLDALTFPFLANVDQAPAIMTAHVLYPHYDTNIATWSKFLLDQLRGNGFEGVLITDDLRMDSVTRIQDYRDAAIDAVLAGHNIVLSIAQPNAEEIPQWKSLIEGLFDALLQANTSGLLPNDIVHDRLRRILLLKLRYLSWSRNWRALSSQQKQVIQRRLESGAP